VAVIRYLVNDVGVALEFYSDILGSSSWKRGARPDRLARCGEQILVNDPPDNPVEMFASSGE
jgi:catechol 2,3-dioxygenase-like lactoylglutathione lyase family enzyme